MTVIGLIQDSDESVYRREVEQLALWCAQNNLQEEPPVLAPLILLNSTESVVENFRFLGSTISQDLKWAPNIDTIVKKAQQRLHFLRQLKKFNLPQALLIQFYSAVIQSVLCLPIIVWFDLCLLCLLALDGHQPKLFLTMRPSWQTVYYGETVTLSCQMNIDIPGLQYQWYKDGERLQAPYAVGHTVESHIYTISAIVWSDQGEYKCQAHTGKPSVQSYTSRPLVLNITEHPEVSFLQWPTWTVLFAGEKLTLNCRVNGDPQIKKFRWFMATANHLRRNLSCENIPGCSITFSDKNQSGLYWCETESGEKRSKAVSFTVTDNMVALQTPPLPLTEGDDVTLECRTRYPTSHMTKVYHEDQEMQPSVWYTRVKKEHEGRYKCVVFSRQTLVASSEEVNITVRDFFSSVMLTVISGLSVKKGEMVKLTCEVKNNSLQKLPVHYSFLKDGEVLYEGENIAYTIMKMNKSHAGNYMCVASIGHDIQKESAVKRIHIAKGAMLCQDVNGDDHPIRYLSQKDKVHGD
ncbi:sialoadhesin-like [Polypterus senegalus]|uniref:sialoadhesin-like n=1 Tax=Polypterus senegalus TaxID=55291 RepID=UPI0019642275|nr:sialoadhesin-like [Polypterus senegalus]